MRIIALSDLHGQGKYFNYLREDLEQADLLTIAGDLSKDGQQESVAQILKEIQLYYNNTIVAVHGNWDKNEVLVFLKNKGFSLHAEGRIIHGLGFFGVGGSNLTPMKTFTEYSEEEISFFLETGFRAVKSASKKILITHVPPKKTKDKTFLGIRGGSQVVRNFIEKNKIDLCLCGHIHEAWGLDLLGETKIVNSGSFKKGRYAVIEINDSVEVKFKRLRKVF